MSAVPAFARLTGPSRHRRRAAPALATPRHLALAWPPGTPPPGAPPGAGIDLGAAVRVLLARDGSVVSRRFGTNRLCRNDGSGLPNGIEEGVVIGVVPPGAPVALARVLCPPASARLRRSLTHYVVQCWDRRVLRHAGEIVVDSP